MARYMLRFACEWSNAEALISFASNASEQIGFGWDGVSQFLSSICSLGRAVGKQMQDPRAVASEDVDSQSKAVSLQSHL